MRNQPILLALFVSAAATGSSCGASDSNTATFGQAQPGDEGAAGNTSRAGTGGFGPQADTYRSVVDPPVNLTSPVFGSLEDLVRAGGRAGLPGVACEYGDSPTCDFTRVDNCCSHLACKSVTDDPDDTFSTRACEALVSCVKTNVGCSTPSDPVCFLGADGRDDPNALCATEAYNAGHSDADSSFEHAVELINCLCGYSAW